MTRHELIALLQDADELLRQAIQAQRGIGLDAGRTPDALRAESQTKIGLVLEALATVPRKVRE